MWGALAVILGTITFLVYLMKLYFERNLEYWSKQGVTFLKCDLSMFDFFTGKKTPVDFDTENYKQLGDQKFGGTLELGRPMLLVKDLELIKFIMVKDFDHFVDHRDFIDTDPLFSKSLFFLHGQEWKDMRNFLSPTFTSGKIKRMFHHFERSSEKLLSYIQTHHEKVDGGFNVLVPETISRFTVDVIGATAFGMETDALSNTNSVFYKMAQRSSEISTKRLVKFGIFSFYPKFGNFFKMQSMDVDVSEFFSGILSHALRAREGKTEKREDFLQMLTEAKQGQLKDDEDEVSNESNGTSKNSTQKAPKLQLTEKLAISQAFLFFMAGFDTIANVLGEAIYLLGVHPEIQKKLHEEVQRFIQASTNGKISYESANKMEYMEMVISEILRQYPPVQRLERKCAKSYTIPDTNIVIPKGMMVGVPVEAIHNDERYYPNPHKFDPERFNAENKAKRNPYTYLPFGTGPRNCIGMRLALIEAKVALAYVIQNFLIEPLPGKTPIPVKMWNRFGFTRVPYDLHMRMIPRNK